MINIKALEKNEKQASGKTYLEEYEESLKARGFKSPQLKELLEVSQARKESIFKLETTVSNKNKKEKELFTKKSKGEDVSKGFELLKKKKHK